MLTPTRSLGALAPDQDAKTIVQLKAINLADILSWSVFVEFPEMR